MNHFQAVRKSGIASQEVTEAAAELQRARQSAVEFEEEAKEMKEKYDMANRINGISVFKPNANLSKSNSKTKCKFAWSKTFL